MIAEGVAEQQVGILAQALIVADCVPSEIRVIAVVFEVDVFVAESQLAAAIQVEVEANPEAGDLVVFVVDQFELLTSCPKLNGVAGFEPSVAVCAFDVCRVPDRTDSSPVARSAEVLFDLSVAAVEAPVLLPSYRTAFRGWLCSSRRFTTSVL